MDRLQARCSSMAIWLRQTWTIARDAQSARRSGLIRGCGPIQTLRSSYRGLRANLSDLVPHPCPQDEQARPSSWNDVHSIPLDSSLGEL